MRKDDSRRDDSIPTKKSVFETEYSPSFKNNYKLLERRESIAPARLRSEAIKSMSHMDKGSVLRSNRSKTMDCELEDPSETSIQVEKPTSKSIINAPNLTKLFSTSADKQKRPDSSMSFSSTSTTTTTSAFSDADSGIDFSRKGNNYRVLRIHSYIF